MAPFTACSWSEPLVGNWSEMLKKSLRYIDLRGLKYWFRRDIPIELKPSFNNKTAHLINLQTSDIQIAIHRRDQMLNYVNYLYDQSHDPAARLVVEENLNTLLKKWITAESPLTTIKALETTPSIAVKISSVYKRTDQHLEAYIQEARLASKTAMERSHLIRRFAEWAKLQRISIDQVDRLTAGRYYTDHISPLHKSTAKKHLGSVKLYWDYLIKRGHITGQNPWQGQAMPDRGRRIERSSHLKERPFTEKEMQTLLYSPFPLRMNEKYKAQLYDAMRISALSGMRLAEIITIWVEECITDENGYGYFNIRQGKTSAAKRTVPMHPDLVEIIQRRKRGKQPDDWLFHELSKERDPSDIFSKRFAAYRNKLDVSDLVKQQRRSLVNFHSFRRWFITKAEQAGIQESTISEVVGHTEGRKSIALKVYSSGPSDQQKITCVNSIKLPNLVL